MLTDKQISALRAPFPPEALSADTSRGFELTSIKAAYVIERLNEVFGTCGIGWRYAHAPFEFIDGEVLTEVALQYAVTEGGTHAVAWQDGDWCFVDGSDSWSWPIFAAGGKRVGKGSAPITDARKSAVTDGLTKAASMIGVGHEVFKGHVRVGQTRQGVPERARRSRETQGSQVPTVKPRRTALRDSGRLVAARTAPPTGGWLTSIRTSWIVPRSVLLPSGFRQARSTGRRLSRCWMT